jgi:hypothetical protein
MAGFKRIGSKVLNAPIKNREYRYDGLDSGVNPAGGA